MSSDRSRQSRLLVVLSVRLLLVLPFLQCDYDLVKLDVTRDVCVGTIPVGSCLDACPETYYNLWKFVIRRFW